MKSYQKKKRIIIFIALVVVAMAGVFLLIQWFKASTTGIFGKSIKLTKDSSVMILTELEISLPEGATLSKAHFFPHNDRLDIKIIKINDAIEFFNSSVLEGSQKLDETESEILRGWLNNSVYSDDEIWEHEYLKNKESVMLDFYIDHDGQNFYSDDANKKGVSYVYTDGNESEIHYFIYKDGEYYVVLIRKEPVSEVFNNEI